MKILSECKRFLAYGGLGNDRSVNIGGTHIPRIFIRIFIYFLEILLDICHTINCINNIENGIQAVLYPLHCLVLNVIKLATFGVLIRKTGRIAELIDYLHMVVNQRRFFFWVAISKSVERRVGG